jgi:cell division inhibitor SepF
MAGAWRKTLIYLGLVEDEDLDDYGQEDAAPEPAARSISRTEREPRSSRRDSRDSVVRSMPTTPSARFHLVSPTAFNDAQEIGDKYREGFSVIMNLAGAAPDIARRLVDFGSGLAYGLAGSMQQVADRVFLLTPQGVQVSAEERRRFLEERGFFNQA